MPKREKAKILAAMQSKSQSNHDKMLTEQLMDEQLMLNAIFKAHNETCDFTLSKMSPIFNKAAQKPIYADYPSQMVSMVCVLVFFFLFKFFRVNFRKIQNVSKKKNSINAYFRSVAHSKKNLNNFECTISSARNFSIFLNLFPYLEIIWRSDRIDINFNR